MYQSLLIHSSADGHLGWFHVLAIMNGAVMNIGVHVSLSIRSHIFYEIFIFLSFSSHWDDTFILRFINLWGLLRNEELNMNVYETFACSLTFILALHLTWIHQKSGRWGTSPSFKLCRCLLHSLGFPLWGASSCCCLWSFVYFSVIPQNKSWRGESLPLFLYSWHLTCRG